MAYEDLKLIGGPADGGSVPLIGHGRWGTLIEVDFVEEMHATSTNANRRFGGPSAWRETHERTAVYKIIRESAGDEPGEAEFKGVYR